MRIDQLSEKKKKISSSNDITHENVQILMKI